MLGAICDSALLDQSLDGPFDLAFFVEEVQLFGNCFGFKGLIVVAQDKLKDSFFQFNRFIHVKKCIGINGQLLQGNPDRLCRCKGVGNCKPGANGSPIGSHSI